MFAKVLDALILRSSKLLGCLSQDWKYRVFWLLEPTSNVCKNTRCSKCALEPPFGRSSSLSNFWNFQNSVLSSNSYPKFQIQTWHTLDFIYSLININISSNYKNQSPNLWNSPCVSQFGPISFLRLYIHEIQVHSLMNYACMIKMTFLLT